MKLKAAITSLAVIGTVASLPPPSHAVTKNCHARFGKTTFIIEDCGQVFDMLPGETLVTLMLPKGSPGARCANMGGKFEHIGSAGSFNLILCVGVDF